MKSNNPIKRILLSPLVFLGVLLMLLEERLWDWFVRLGIWLGQRPAMRQAEARMRILPPKGAAIALFFPVALIFPVKVLAVWVMSTGRWGLGVAILLSAKLVGTALVAWIYTLCEPALSQLAWFVHLRAWFLDAKDWAHRKLEAWLMWRFARQVIYRIKSKLKALLSAGIKLE